MSRPTIRAGFEGSGSPRWLMRTIQAAGLDAAHGFGLEIVNLAEGRHRHGTLGALAEGRVDLADADRQALALARADGLDLVAVAPYGRIYGSVVARRGLPVAPAALAALKGARLGVLSLADKNWTLLADALTHRFGADLATVGRPIRLASRTELAAALDDGRIDFALAHWHQVPGLEAAGHRVLIELPDLADLKGLPDAATTHFVMREADVAARPGLADAFCAALAGAARRMTINAAPWHALAAEGAFAAALVPGLRARWQARVGRYLTSPDLSRSELQ